MDIHLVIARLSLALALSGAASAAAAQAVTPAPEVAPVPGTEPTIPEQVYPCNPGGYDAPAGTNEEKAERLADCEGVIAPPPTGDAEAEVDPPDAGRTPVISPDSVPEQESGGSAD